MMQFTDAQLASYDHGFLVGKLIRGLNKRPSPEAMAGTDEYSRGFRDGYYNRNERKSTFSEER